MAGLALRHADQLFEFEPTPADAIPRVLAALGLGAQDVVYDLGSGYGDVCLLGTMTSSARFVGVELVRERHAAAERLRERFGLARVGFVHANALEVDLGEASAFYVFSPFLEPANAEMCRRLARIAAERPIRIAATLTAATGLAAQPELSEFAPALAQRPSIRGIPVRFFRSRPGG